MFSVMSRNFWMSSKVFGEEVGWGGLGNKGPLVRRKRGDRCSRSGGKGGCRRGCRMQRWGGMFRLSGVTGKVRRSGRHRRSGRY